MSLAFESIKKANGLVGLVLLTSSFADAATFTRSKLLNLSLPVAAHPHAWTEKKGYESKIIQDKFAAEIEAKLSFRCKAIEGINFVSDSYALARFLEATDDKYTMADAGRTKRPISYYPNNSSIGSTEMYFRLYKDASKPPHAGLQVHVGQVTLMGKTTANYSVAICSF